MNCPIFAAVFADEVDLLSSDVCIRRPNLASVVPYLSFAFTSAPSAISSSTISLWPFKAAPCKGVPPIILFAFTSAPLAISSSAISLRPCAAAICKGVLRYLSFASTSVPAAKCCLTASMLPSSIASRIEMSGALAVGGSGFAASATGSTGFDSGAGADCCDSPDPAHQEAATYNSTAAIVAISKLVLDGCFSDFPNFIVLMCAK